MVFCQVVSGCEVLSVESERVQITRRWSETSSKTHNYSYIYPEALSLDIL